MNDYKKLDKLMLEYREIREGYIFYGEDRDMHNYSNDIKQSFKISFEFSETIEAPTFEGILEELTKVIEKIKSGYLSLNEIEYRGFSVKIFELHRGFEANAKSGNRELHILLPRTYIYSDAEKEVKLYLDAFLHGESICNQD